MELCWKSQPYDWINARDVLLGFGESGDAGTDIDDQWDATSNDSSAFFFFQPYLKSLVHPNRPTGDHGPLVWPQCSTEGIARHMAFARTPP